MIKSFLKSHFISGRIAGEKMKKNCDFIKPLALLSKIKRANVPKGPSFLILILSVTLSASLIKTNVRKNESKMYYVVSLSTPQYGQVIFEVPEGKSIYCASQ